MAIGFPRGRRSNPANDGHRASCGEPPGRDPRRGRGVGIRAARRGGNPGPTDTFLVGATLEPGTPRLLRKSWCLRFERAHDTHDALSPRVDSPGVARNYQRFSRPSPFHPLFEYRVRYAGNSEIQRPRDFAGDSETRTRTGDTTIFSRYVLDAVRRAIPGNKRFRRGARATAMSAICRFIGAIQGMAGLPSPF
jgi:hypothetical protein